MRKLAYVAAALVAVFCIALVMPPFRRAVAEAIVSALGKPGTAAPIIALQVGGSDGTNLRALSVDSGGRLNPLVATLDSATATSVPLGTSGALSLSGNFVHVGGVESTGGTDHEFITDPAGQLRTVGPSRTTVVIGADGVTPAIAETVVTFTKNVGGTQTTAQTTYTITSGKTLHIQAVCGSFTAGATANRLRLALRLNTGGACVAGSNLLLPVAELAPNYGTATAAEGGTSTCTPIPEGLEILGDGTKAICLSESATAASGTLTASLIAYEY